LCRPQFLQSLTELDLSRNRLGLEGASQIAAMLWQPTCKLARLGLAVARLRDTGVQALAAGFAARSPERSWVPLALNLRSNSIGDDGAEALAVLLDKGWIASILLENNQVGGKGLQALSVALQSDSVVGSASISLGGNPAASEANLVLKVKERRGLKRPHGMEDL
ncbi:unnamed protein product, partial [Polarella glacialis]